MKEYKTGKKTFGEYNAHVFKIVSSM